MVYKSNKTNDLIYNSEFNNWINTFNFKAMLTVKYYNKQGNYECLIQLNKIISNINKTIYGRNYKKNLSFMNGIVAFELNDARTINSFHNHILIPNDYRTNRYSIYQLLDIAKKSSTKLTDIHNKISFNHHKNEIVFNSDGVSGIDTGCFHIIEKYSDNAVSYITKKMNMESTSIKLLDVNGLNDNDLTFLYQNRK